jgi:hypothetical protein
MRGGSAGTSVRGPENQEGACESMKGQLYKFYACHCFV